MIQKAMAASGIAEKYNAPMQSAPKIPFGGSGNLDIDNCVLGKAVDGLFTMMGEEGKKIRTNPRGADYAAFEDGLRETARTRREPAECPPSRS
jgi:hypothetical protein